MNLVFIILAAFIPLTVSGNRIAACRKLCGRGHQGSVSSIVGRGNLGMSGLSESVPEPCWKPLDLSDGSEDSLGSPMVDDNGNPMHVVRFPQKDSDGNGIFGLYFPAVNKVLTNEGTEYTPMPGMGIDIMYAPPGTSALFKTDRNSINGDTYKSSPLLGDSNNMLCIPILPSAYDPSQLRITKSVQRLGVGASYEGCSSAGRAELCGEDIDYAYLTRFHIIHNPLAPSLGPQQVKECSSGFIAGRSPNRRSPFLGRFGASSRRNTIPREVARPRPFYQLNHDDLQSRACWRDIVWGEPIPENAAGLVRGPGLQSRREQSTGYLTLVGDEYGLYYPNHEEFPLWESMVYSNNLTSPNPKIQLLYYSEGNIARITTNSLEMINNPPANAIKLKSFNTNFQFLCLIVISQHSDSLRSAFNLILGLVDATTGLCHAPFDICEVGNGKIATFVDYYVIGNTKMEGIEFEEPEEAPRCHEQNMFRNY